MIIGLLKPQKHVPRQWPKKEGKDPVKNIYVVLTGACAMIGRQEHAQARSLLEKAEKILQKYKIEKLAISLAKEKNFIVKEI